MRKTEKYSEKRRVIINMRVLESEHSSSRRNNGNDGRGKEKEGKGKI